MIGNYRQRENLKDLFFRFVEWLYLRNSDDYIFYLFSDNEDVNSLSQFLKEMNSSKRDELISFLYNIANGIDLLRIIAEHWIKEDFIICIDFNYEIYSVEYKYHIQKEDKMTFDSEKILKELHDNEEVCSFKIDCVMDGDFDDIRRIIEDECEDCGVSDRLTKKVRILKNDDNCYTICCPSKEVCDLLSNKFEEIGIYGKPSNESKDYRSSIEKYNAEDDIVEPDKSKGKVKVDGDTMYAEDGECGMTSGDAGAYDAPFEIPTKYSKKQMDMIRRGTLESRKILRKSKRTINESTTEEDLFDEFVKWYKNNSETGRESTHRVGIFDKYDVNRFLNFIGLIDLAKKNYAVKLIENWLEYKLIVDMGDSTGISHYMIYEW